MRGFEEREREIKAIWQEYHFFYTILRGVAIFSIGLVIGLLIFKSDSDRSSYFINLFTDGLGVILTVLVLNYFAEQREERREIRELKARLIRELGSSINEVAKHAAEELSAYPKPPKRSWLKDGSLRREKFYDANLIKSYLHQTDFQQASLDRAKLVEAGLYNVEFQGAGLWFVDMETVGLNGAYLQGAELWEANLRNAQLEGAHFDENTRLPDGSHWTPDTDLTRFTDPNHPNFWRSDNPGSPAYRDKHPSPPPPLPQGARGAEI